MSNQAEPEANRNLKVLARAATEATLGKVYVVTTKYDKSCQGLEGGWQ
jgi:hypothetical protein